MLYFLPYMPWRLKTVYSFKPCSKVIPLFRLISSRLNNPSSLHQFFAAVPEGVSVTKWVWSSLFIQYFYTHLFSKGNSKWGAVGVYWTTLLWTVSNLHRPLESLTTTYCAVLMSFSPQAPVQTYMYTTDLDARRFQHCRAAASLVCCYCVSPGSIRIADFNNMVGDLGLVQDLPAGYYLFCLVA